MSELRLSVIVPAYNGTGVLEKSLSALRDSDLSRKHWELIVVDDASTDDTGTLAAQYADRVVRLDGRPHGPSYARNRAAELAKGDRLRLTVEAVDYRGNLPGESYLSDPLVLEISDESGVLSAISEADERSEERLTDIIKQQLGIGE